MKKTAIFAASLWEIGGVLKSAEFSYEKVRETPYQVWENDTKTVVITGIGLANAATAFSWAASELDFESAINIGAAGAASQKFGTQDLGKIFDVKSNGRLRNCDTRDFQPACRVGKGQGAGFRHGRDCRYGRLGARLRGKSIFKKTLHKKNSHRLLTGMRYTFQYFVNLQDFGKTRKFLDISLAFRLSARH